LDIGYWILDTGYWVPDKKDRGKGPEGPEARGGCQVSVCRIQIGVGVGIGIGIERGHHEDHEA